MISANETKILQFFRPSLSIKRIELIDKKIDLPLIPSSSDGVGLRSGFVPDFVRSADALGWIKSAKSRMPIDVDGNPIPWHTYPALHFLAKRNLKTLNVFEYGSGNSTLWWAKQCSRVTSVEHDAAWHRTMESKIPSNVTYVHRELIPGGEYCREILEYSNTFDVVVVDGRDRVNCSLQALSRMGDHSVLIWDNSERERYSTGLQQLENQGFRRIDFSGFGHVNPEPWQTSIFYKNGNCLNI